MTNIRRKITRSIKTLIENAFAIHIIKTPPRGFNFIHDARHLNWPEEPTVVFDVGANVGQSAIPLAAAFKGAHIECFEPSSENFRTLIENTRRSHHIHCHQIALGSMHGEGTLLIGGQPDMFRIVDGELRLGPTEQVPLTTIDRFCIENNIKKIDILKIDTEGLDLEVMKGATKLFIDQAIHLVNCEVSMNRANQYHASMHDILDFMLLHNYLLFGVYEQQGEWIERKPYLRRANLVFISPLIADITLR